MRVFLGTGLIGAAMAEAACARGESVRVWNRTRAKADALAAFGAEVADDPVAALEGADTIHLALPADAQVDAVLEGIAGSVPRDAVVVDHSTTSPEGARGRVAAMAARGVAFLHAPVFMSPASCRAQAGVMVVCGPSAAWERVRPALDAMTGTAWYVGEEGHRAATFKLAGNGMILSVISGLADVMTMAAAQGVDPVDVMALFDRFDLGHSLKGRGGRMATGDDAVSWTLAMARKDLGLMLDAAGGRDLALLPAVGSRMDAMIGQGESEADLSILARDVRHE